MHRHTELEFNLVLGGAAAYLLGEHRHELTRGSLLWLFPSQDHALLDCTPDFSMWIAVFTPQLVRRVCIFANDVELTESFATPERCGRQISEPELGHLEKLLRDIAVLTNVPGDSRIARVNAGLPWLLLRAWDIHNSADTALSNQKIHPAVEHAVRLLRAETKPVLLDQLASEVGLSKSRLGHLFREQIGITVPAFRNRQRIERYLRLRHGDTLASRCLSCHRAALEAGFGSYAQFHRVFQALIGCPPSSYRAAQD